MAETETNYGTVMEKVKEIKELKRKFKQSIKEEDDGSVKSIDEETKAINDEVNKIRVTYQDKRNTPLTGLSYECRIYLTNKANDLGQYFGAQKYYYTAKIIEVHPNKSDGIKVELGREIFGVKFSNVCINSAESSATSTTSASSTPSVDSKKQDGGNITQDGGYYNPYNPYKQYYQTSQESEVSSAVNDDTQVELSQTSAFNDDTHVELSQTSAFDDNTQVELSQTSAFDDNT